MSLILKQEAANTVPTPPAGKTTIFVDSTNSNTLSTINSAGSTTSYLTANISGGNLNFGTSNLVTTGNITANNITANISGNLVLSGTNTGVVFNDSGSASAASTFTFDKTTNNVYLNGNANIAGNTTLTNLTVTGTLIAGDIAVSSIANGTSNVDIVGVSGNVTISVTGNANILTVTGTGVNVAGTLNTGTGNISAGNINAGNLLTANYFTGNGNGLSSIVGANVSGFVPNANVANTAFAVAGANVSGAVSFATTANAVAGANVSGAVSFATTANAVAGANVSGTVANATYALSAGSADSATTAGTVTTAAQPNITSVGTLTSLSVTGNITNGNITGGNLVSASYLTGTLTTAAQPNITSTGTLTSLTVSGNIGAGNVSATTFTGALSGAATTAGTVTTAAQPNITSTGTLTSLSVTGNANVGNLGTTALVATSTGSFGGNVNLNSFNIVSLATPVNDTDAATKAYVDTVAQGLDTKASVVAATTANITLSGTQTIDGVAVTAGQRVLVKNQTAPADNGLYLCAAGSWTRTTDMTTWAQVPGAYVFVEGGSTQADTGWVCTSDAGGTIGVTAMTWAQFSGAGSYTAGTGLTLTGTSFSVNVAQSQITSVGTLTGLTLAANADITMSGTDSNITGGNLVSASYLTGTLTTASQPNITSTGTLTSLTVSGNIGAGNVSATTFTGALSGAATTAGTVTTAAQGNITSVGTLTGLNVNGTITGVNITANTGVFTGNGSALTALNASNISSGTLAQARLANASVTLGSTALTLGSTVTTVAGLTSVTSTTFVGALTGAATSATTAGTVTTAAQPNITSVGTLTGLTLSNAAVISVGSNTNVGTFTGNFSLSAGSRLNATYADLSEKYVADAEHEPSTVLVFGGNQEVTLANEFDSTRVAGVVTTNPAYTMNNDCQGEYVVNVALQGRVPVKVSGNVAKGDLMVSGENGRAIANNEARAGTIIGKSLENFTGTEGIIEVAVGRF